MRPHFHTSTPPYPHTPTRTPVSFFPGRLVRVLLIAAGAAIAVLSAGCTNAPYPADVRDSSIRFATIAGDPTSLDPSVAYDVDSESILANIDDTFLQYHYLKRSPVELIPSMGARMPERTSYTFTEMTPEMNAKGDPVRGADGRPGLHPVVRHGEIWTFTLKRGLYYADNPCFRGGKGREVTAADFVYSLKRMADPSVNCPILSYMAPHVLGLQAFFDSEEARMEAAKTKEKHGGKPYVCNMDTPVAGLQVDPADPYTFRIILRDAYPELKYLMAMTLTAPIPREAVAYYNGGDHGQFRQHPVGAGSYYLAEWSERERLVLKRNPSYRSEVYPSDGMPGDVEKGLLEDAGKPLPLNDEIIYSIIKETIPGWNLFLQGYLDSFGVPKEAFNKVVTTRGDLSPDMKARGIHMETATDMDVFYLAFNMDDSLVGGYTPARRKLRQALSLAIDSPEIIDIIMNGRGIPAQSVVPPGLFGYDPSYKNPYMQTNLDKAKRLLAEAGYPGGIDPATQQPLVINFDTASSTPEGREETGLVIRQLDTLGINVIERPSMYNVFMGRVAEGQFQMCLFGWNADYPDPENFYLLFYGPNKGPGPNTARYSNPEFDRLYKQMAAMDNGPDRLQVIDRMRQMVQEDCPWIFLYHTQAYILRYDWVKNALAHPVAMNTAKYVRIDHAVRFRDQEKWNHPDYLVVALFFGMLFLGTVPAALIVQSNHRKSARAGRRTLVRISESDVPESSTETP